MINKWILTRMNELVPARKMSDFVNGALEEAIVRYGRLQAAKAMDEMRENMKLRMSTEEMIKLKNYGRK